MGRLQHEKSKKSIKKFIQLVGSTPPPQFGLENTLANCASNAAVSSSVP